MDIYSEQPTGFIIIVVSNNMLERQVLTDDHYRRKQQAASSKQADLPDAGVSDAQVNALLSCTVGGKGESVVKKLSVGGVLEIP